MKERTIVKSAAGLVAAIIVLATRNTDAIFVSATLLFFIICIAYAEWCERL
jgi:methyl coenzyme M reductase beta subunit